MNTVNIKKLLLPNLPYLFLFWLFDKIGEAYRLAPGNDILHKLTATTAKLHMVIAHPMPSFDTFDLLVGFVGASAIFATVQYKRRNARKWRKEDVCSKGWQRITTYKQGSQRVCGTDERCGPWSSS